MRILLRPVHNWVWLDTARRARKLLRFAETEAEGGRDLVRAAEVTPDPLLRRLFMVHARDEQRHAELFRRRGALLLQTLSGASGSGYRADWLAPGERGLDDLRIEELEDAALLAFLHLSEKCAAGDFASYRDVLERIAQALLDREVLDAVELKLIMENKPLPDKAPPPPPAAPPVVVKEPQIALRPDPRPIPGMAKGEKPAPA